MTVSFAIALNANVTLFPGEGLLEYHWSVPALKSGNDVELLHQRLAAVIPSCPHLELGYDENQIYVSRIVLRECNQAKISLKEWQKLHSSVRGVFITLGLDPNRTINRSL